MENMTSKLERLKQDLINMGKVAVAFSSGVDSAFLLKVAHDLLGDNAVAVTARSAHFPQREYEEAVEFCRKENIRHIIVESNELEIPGFAENPVDRCYICKKSLFQKMVDLAKTEDLGYLVEGSNMDDTGDYRPGMRAIKELGIQSPLKKAELFKAEIRQLSKDLDLGTWDKPSYACLASRFPYNEMITEEKLKMVELGEEYLISKGFIQMRVRIHDCAGSLNDNRKYLARIEVPEEDIEKVTGKEFRKNITEAFKKIGFSFVTLDLCGFKSGGLNDGLVLEK